MIAIVDYGVGNLFSVKSSLEFIGEKCIAASDADLIKKADRIILPGVGAFRDAKKKLEESGIQDLIKEEAASGKPILGICLGMQLLFEKSFENGEYDGLGLIEGNVCPIKDAVSSELSVPHIGWNSLDITKDTPLFKYIKNGDCVYFVHSYYGANCEKNTVATSSYGVPLTAAVQKDNVFGCQFHPEKSGDVGLNILRAFARI